MPTNIRSMSCAGRLPVSNRIDYLESSLKIQGALNARGGEGGCWRIWGLKGVIRVEAYIA